MLAMIPLKYTDKSGIRSAMRELALKMLSHNPSNWLSRNYIELAIPQLQPVHGALEWTHGHWPEVTERLLLAAVATRTPVITALYTNMEDVVNLIEDLKGGWLQNNRDNGYPISIVLSGLFDDVHRCCQRTGSQEHTYLHSLGFFGKTEELPSQEELEIITMCGHGLVSSRLAAAVMKKVRSGKMSPQEGAHFLAQPCPCGIFNTDRCQALLAQLTEELGADTASES